MLRDLGITKMRLMSNNPAKFTAMEAYGLEVVERVPLEAPGAFYENTVHQARQAGASGAAGRRRRDDGPDDAGGDDDEDS